MGHRAYARGERRQRHPRRARTRHLCKQEVVPIVGCRRGILVAARAAGLVPAPALLPPSRRSNGARDLRRDHCAARRLRGLAHARCAASSAIAAGKVERNTWKLPDVDHVFLPGHRIMVQVQSTLFPLYDRNPQTYVENIMYAKKQDYKKATQKIWFGGANASAIVLPVVD